MSPYLVGVLLVMLSAVSFGAMPIFARFAYASGADPSTVLFLRFTAAGLFMLALTRLQRLALPRGRVLWAIIAMGAAGYFGQSLSYFTALTLAPAGLVALLLYLYPALVTGLSVIILKEQLTTAKVTALLLALGGAALVIFPTSDLADAVPAQPRGIVLGVLAAVIYSIYILVGARVMKHAAAIPVSTVIMLSAALSFGLLAAGRSAAGLGGLHLPLTTAGWWAMTGLTLISTVLALATFLAGIERIGPSSASLLSTLEPVVSVILAVLVLEESLNPLQAAGGVLILAAVLALTTTERQQNAKSPSPG
jgi:drug/metabolite transporter (DMT)-like permease